MIVARLFRFLLFTAAVVFAALWISCQSDTPAATNTSGGENSEQAVSAEKQADDAALDPVQIKAAALARAREMEQQAGRFLTKVQDLRKQVNAIPGAKEMAIDFPELEARLDGYLEKGAYVQNELRQLVEQLSGAGDAAGPADTWSNKLEEETRNLEGFQAGGVALDKAVDKLKKANGKKVQLFEE